MTTEYKYETIEGVKIKYNFWRNAVNLKLEERNMIITNLVEKIEQYEKAREIETKYNKKILENGEEKILGAEMKSKDGIIKGKIYWRKSYSVGGSGMWGISKSDSVKAKFNFNSNNEADKIEYIGLVKLIKAM